MTAEAAPDLIRLLEESRLELNAAAAGLSEAQATAVPETGGWSVLQCVEHVAGVEERFLGRLSAAPRLEAPVESRGAELAHLTANRGRRVQAPEAVHPTGRFTSLAEALEAFNSVRGRVAQVTQERAADLELLALEHSFFGVLNGVGMVAVIAGHARRHAGQVREIRASLGIPA
jgi:uncharacterized damage-inducible protein DinB